MLGLLSQIYHNIWHCTQLVIRVQPSHLSMHIERIARYNRVTGKQLLMQQELDSIVDVRGRIHDYALLTATLHQLYTQAAIAKPSTVIIELSDALLLPQEQQALHTGCIIYDQQQRAYAIDGRLLLQYYCWARQSFCSIQQFSVVPLHE